MLKSQSNKNIEIGSEKSFGLLFGLIFFLLGLYFLHKDELIFLVFFLLASLFFFLAFFAPNFLIFLNKAWHKFGIFLGLFISPVVMLFIFCLTVIPIGLIMKLAKKDPLKKKFSYGQSSYWIDREKPDTNMTKQY